MGNKRLKINEGGLFGLGKIHDDGVNVAKIDDNNNDVTNDKTYDIDSVVSGDVSSVVNSDKIDDVYNDNKDDNDSYGNISITSDNNDDVISYIDSYISTTIEKQPKYTDIHTRKTYYIENALLKKIERHKKKYGKDNSKIINDALTLYFKLIEAKSIKK